LHKAGVEVLGFGGEVQLMEPEMRSEDKLSVPNLPVLLFAVFIVIRHQNLERC